MYSDVVERFIDILVAIKDDSELSEQLIKICKLPKQQRIIEINTYLFQNSEHIVDSDFIYAIQLLKENEYAGKTLKYLQAT